MGALGFGFPDGGECCCGTSETLVVITHTPIALTQDISAVPQTQATTNVNGSWSGVVAAIQITDASFMVDSWTGADGDILDATDLHLLVPSYATIVGITVAIARKGSAISVLSDKVVQLLIAGTPTGSNKASATTYTTSVVNASYGGAADLWGNTLTPADIMDSGFGVRFQPKDTSGIAVTVSVDRIFITVRYTVPTTANITRVDETTHAPTWGYDLGLTVASQKYHPGPPIIDADGNIYCASRGTTDTTLGAWHEETLLQALDKDGNSLWTWSSGDMLAFSGTPITGAFDPICFDINGNILIGHRLTISGTYFLSCIDPTGAVVFQVAYPSGSIPALINFTTRGPTGIGIDSAGNIYLAVNSTGADSNQILVFDSSGTYITRVTGIATRDIRVDDTLDKIFLFPTVSVNGSNSTTLVTRLDCAALTVDWTKSFIDIDPGVSASSTIRLALTFQAGIDSSGNALSGAVFANTTTNRNAVYSIDGSGTTVFVLMPVPPGIASPSSADYRASFITADFVPGDVYLLVNSPLATNFPIGFKTSNLGGTYFPIWSMTVDALVGGSSFGGIGARTI